MITLDTLKNLWRKLWFSKGSAPQSLWDVPTYVREEGLPTADSQEREAQSACTDCMTK
jgi:hypothetical protein